MMPVAAPGYEPDQNFAPPLEPDDRFLLVTDRADTSSDLETILRGAGEVVIIAPADLEAETSDYFRIFVDIDLANTDNARKLRRRFEGSSLRSIPRYFIIGKDDVHHERTQAWALGAAEIVARPLGAEDLLRKISADCSATFHREVANSADPVCAGIAAAHGLLVKMFEGLKEGQGLTLDEVLAQEEPITRALAAAGLKSWLDVVSRHHNHSYRHCLSVTGFTIAFAQHLGFNENDQRRLARAALLHDVGKAFVPLALLDKPGKLTELEMEEMRLHASLGYAALAMQGGFPQETLDVVLHHHELLDGTGYPERLSGARISDLVRMVTITDIYSALIEERAYRSGMARDEAYALLEAMGGKLDQDLVRAFRYIAVGRS